MFMPEPAVPRSDERSLSSSIRCKHAWDRDCRDNPLFTAGDLIYNYVHHPRVPEMPDYYRSRLSTVSTSAFGVVQRAYACWVLPVAQRNEKPGQQIQGITGICMG